MFYSLSGKLIIKNSRFAVIEVNGFGFRVFISSRTFRRLPELGSRIRLFCYTYSYQNGTDLYGFLEEKEREIFELLNSISGVGPKAALKILNEMRVESLLTSISQGRSDLLTRAVGIGRKKAARIILELGDKIKKQKNETGIDSIESDFDLEEVLKSLGYKRNEIRQAINKMPKKVKTIQEKIKSALKILSRKNLVL